VLLPRKPESAAVAPTRAANYPNGQLPASVLEPCGIREYVMVSEAARACRALMRKAKRDGVRLWTSGSPYRNFAGQVALFLKRYTQTPHPPPWRREYFRGSWWYLKHSANGKPVAGAAKPGTSNHGRGTAIDFARKNIFRITVALDTKTLNWLAVNGPLFGFWNTVTTENWHWCWCLGDGPMPAAVFAEENGTIDTPTTMPRLTRGARGPAVVMLQKALNAAGATPPLEVDGGFGKLTEQAVRDFQTKHDLIVDGIAGSQTWGELQ